MIDIQIHECPVCKERFEVACQMQLEDKLKNHKCSPERIKTQKVNKKRERARQLRRSQAALYVQDYVVNSIEEARFNKLVQQGVIV